MTVKQETSAGVKITKMVTTHKQTSVLTNCHRFLLISDGQVFLK